MTLGEKILVLRKQNGLSQEQLAEKITISRQAISRWELNESIPDVDNILQLSRVFGVSTDYLLTDRNDLGETYESGGREFGSQTRTPEISESATHRPHEMTRHKSRREQTRGIRKLCVFVGLLSPIIYVLFGFAFGWWHPGWIIIVAPWLVLAAFESMASL